jgi:hypothetical protein
VASRDCGATAAGRLRDPNGFGLAAGPREVVAWSGGTVGHMTPGPSAENRHGGAPRGAVPVARDGPRLASAVSRLASATGLPSAPFGAPPTPRSGVGTKREENPAQKRATGMKKTALFDIVKMRSRERRIGKVALDRIAAAATHSASAEGALRRAFSPAIVHARA